jgi:hypothetical protein
MSKFKNIVWGVTESSFNLFYFKFSGLAYVNRVECDFMNARLNSADETKDDVYWSVHRRDK